MARTELAGRDPATPRRLPQGVGGAALSAAWLAAAGAAGVLVSVRTAYPRPPRAAPPEGWPPARTVPEGRLAVAVVLGASGSVITDALGPYEVFARSPGFFVYTVSASRPTAMLSGALAAVPDYSLDDVDTGTAPEPDVIVVPAVLSPAGRAEQPLREWLARRASRGAHLLGVCAGSRLLAAAGLLDGHRATSHWSRLRGLQRSRPQVDWVRGQRYVQDGKITTTAGVTSGVFGALRLVQQLAGDAEAQRVGRELAYPGWSLDGPTGIPAQRPAPSDLANVLTALAPWRRSTLGVGLIDGAGELDIAAAFEVYASSFAARTVPIAARRTITTRHGLRLAAAPASASAPPVDRLIMPGAWHLAHERLRFVVLEAGPELGHTWRSRWDSLTLFTPAQYDALPGMPFPGPPDTYPAKDPVAAYLKAYAAAFDLPVRLNARVTALTRTADGFEIRVGDGVLRARQVVVATGPFQLPFTPPAAQRLDDSVTQLHSAGYRNPSALPPGPVLVVGGGNSGFQIAEELAATRPVDLSVATRAPVLPQRLAGKDLFWWLTRLGLMQVTAGSRLGRRMSSREFIIGGSRRRLKAAGVRFRPAVAGADGRNVRFADGSSLDAGIVIWATGYRPDYAWIHIPGVTRDGQVIYRRGVTDVPGLYFVGLSWQHTRGSALLGFVHEDAAYLAGLITSQARSATAAGSRPASHRLA